MDYNAIIKDINKGDFKPIYVLHGEEPFYIDAIEKKILEKALDDSERDFNQLILYGRDVKLIDLISEAISIPFMGERKVLVIREAQDFSEVYELERLLTQLAPKNIVVICYKHKNLDGKRKFTKEAPKYGVLFKSEKIKDYNLTEWITTYVKSQGFDITSKAAALIAEFVGNDLSRIVNELDKLAIVLTKGTKISDIHVEENIGISKDYNVFELVKAIETRDSLKAFQIADYFEKNPKNNPLVVVIPTIFKLFINMMRVHFAEQKSADYIAAKVGLHPFVAKQLMQSSANFPPKILARNVDILHQYDLKAKGVGNSSVSDGQLLKEMLFQLLN